MLRIRLESLPWILQKTVPKVLWPATTTVIMKDRILVSIAVEFGKLLTFGIISPPVCVVVLCSIYSESKFWKVLLA